MIKAAMGIDPGGSGFAGVLTAERQLYTCRFQPKGKQNRIERWCEVAEFFEDVSLLYTVEACLEATASRRSDSKQNAHSFGINKGIVQGFLYTWRIPHNYVGSKEWQRFFKLGGRFGPAGCSDAVAKQLRKSAQQALAQELFPNEKVTLDMADGLLIADYQWHKMFGSLSKKGK